MRKVLSSAEVGVRFMLSERNVFRFDFEGEVLFGCCHVDDILFAPSSDRIRLEFLRRIRNRFAITGGDEPCTSFCGMELEHNAEKRTIKIHQSDFERRVLEKYGAMSLKPAPTPKKVGEGPLRRYGGVASEQHRMDFMTFIGDLQWLVRTNPRLAFSCQELSHFVSNPGPDHFAAALRVLANIRGHIGQGITYHGSSEVLLEKYDHRHVLLAATDSNFSHSGEKATTGVVVLLNGGPIFHSSRLQSTVSMNSAEAEVKAAATCAEIMSGIAPLWSEITGRVHPPVRCLIDNKSAKRQIESGIDTAASAAYLKYKRYAESKVYAGIVWFDYVPGEVNFADLCTKQVRDTTEFLRKDGVASGAHPSMFESEAMMQFLRSD